MQRIDSPSLVSPVASSLASTPASGRALEPGLLSVLRVLVGIQLLLLPATVAVFPPHAPANPWPGGDTALGDVVRRLMLEANSSMGPAALRVLLTIPVALYAFWPGLPNRLGRWYLPIFAVYYAVTAALSHAAFTGWVLGYVENLLAQDMPLALLLSMESAWTLFVLLLFGVVIVAWQYDMRHVLGYVVLLAVAETIALGPLLLSSLPWPPLLFQLVVHTAIYVMVGFVITRMMAAQRAQRRALHEANVQLTQYAATQEQLAVSHERNRMARELHDTLAHSLSAVAVQLEAVDSALTTAPDEARTILGKALAQTRSGLTETRRAMQELRASPLDDLGLALAIQNLALITAQRAGVVATVELPERAPNLSPAVEQGVYRIAQEALTNAARHAGATQLKVTLACNGAVALTIADNGRGFDTETVAGDHMGVQLMRERAAMLGGILEIASAPGAGTTVRLVIG
jgi:signal transduction histidine kinase